MEIKIDELQVQEALDKQVTAGIKTAFEGYAVHSTIEKAISESVIPSIITIAMVQAASTIDINNLSQHLAQEIAKSVTRGVQGIIRETMIGIIMDIQKVPQYDANKRREAYAKIEASLFQRSEP
jgi:hypothetical protein